MTSNGSALSAAMRVSSIRMASETDSPISARTLVASSLIFPSIRARTTSVLAIASAPRICSYIVAHWCSRSRALSRTSGGRGVLDICRQCAVCQTSGRTLSRRPFGRIEWQELACSGRFDWGRDVIGSAARPGTRTVLTSSKLSAKSSELSANRHPSSANGSLRSPSPQICSPSPPPMSTPGEEIWCATSATHPSEHP